MLVRLHWSSLSIQTRATPPNFFGVSGKVLKLVILGQSRQGRVPTLRSAINHPDVVSGYLQKECNLGRIGGPFNHPLFLNMQYYPIGVVPKKDQGKFRTILHLSYPQVGQSMILFRQTNTHYTISPLIMPSKPSKDLRKGHSSAS